MLERDNESSTAVQGADAITRIGAIGFLVAPDPDPGARLDDPVAQDRRSQAMSAWLLAEWQRWCSERDAAALDSPVLAEVG